MLRLSALKVATQVMLDAQIINSESHDYKLPENLMTLFSSSVYISRVHNASVLTVPTQQNLYLEGVVFLVQAIKPTGSCTVFDPVPVPAHRKRQHDLRLQLTRSQESGADGEDDKSEALSQQLRVLSRILDVIDQLAMSHETFKEV